MLKILLFWGHFLVGAFGVTVGFYLSLPMVIGLVVLHRLHLVLFRGCAITRFQQYLGHFPDHVDFLEVVAKKFTGREITRVQLKIIDYATGLIPIVAATIRLYI
ncbi:MAG: hypothetical protein A3C03_00300 [Candidatus Colwellbacteria bacterium RIFCSPHIGHO2_02_FULL_45_17]|uniref:Uncharacterized protein n=2 Tax=Candidatus Colwelliibacteriota TaxID=1817904 RepID=A0A1G1ZBY5_9BACT|nr:MAG: hypothetical protein A3C03_00300 [Candidatus Colwellbacteria bacterium RIFCSPHIGHO2_02_FULL_45_17]OGY61579.1 MAG: hypothetical protein A3I33_00465 [Candidatus Colwellbacteria bacterium RIFCSPLOWO2_02_FULL_45_11]OGY62145.1 MAG: hypothetical protein A3G58_02295 [Candidatus Colwellbacteria bacterium RIFCSPLOWO2_12_FULL_46_17]